MSLTAWLIDNAIRAKGILQALYSPDQERDERGRWTSGGGITSDSPHGVEGSSVPSRVRGSSPKMVAKSFRSSSQVPVESIMRSNGVNTIFDWTTGSGVSSRANYKPLSSEQKAVSFNDVTELGRIRSALPGLSRLPSISLQYSGKMTDAAEKNGEVASYVKTDGGSSISLKWGGPQAGPLSLGKDSFFVDGSRSGALRHEYGHHVYSTGMTKAQKNEWKTMWGSKDIVWWADHSSIYATANAEEAFSESFSAFTHKDYGRSSKMKLPPKVETFLKSTLGR